MLNFKINFDLIILFSKCDYYTIIYFWFVNNYIINNKVKKILIIYSLNEIYKKIIFIKRNIKNNIYIVYYAFFTVCFRISQFFLIFKINIKYSNLKQILKILNYY